jgi:hypothetical protein
METVEGYFVQAPRMNLCGELKNVRDGPKADSHTAATCVGFAILNELSPCPIEETRHATKF